MLGIVGANHHSAIWTPLKGSAWIHLLGTWMHPRPHAKFGIRKHEPTNKWGDSKLIHAIRFKTVRTFTQLGMPFRGINAVHTPQIARFCAMFANLCFLVRILIQPQRILSISFRRNPLNIDEETQHPIWTSHSPRWNYFKKFVLPRLFAESLSIITAAMQ